MSFVGQPGRNPRVSPVRYSREEKKRLPRRFKFISSKPFERQNQIKAKGSFFTSRAEHTWFFKHLLPAEPHTQTGFHLRAL